MNIEGVHDKQFGCKLPYLKEHLQSDIEILAETWGNCSHSAEIDGYHLIQIDAQKDNATKKGRKSGGIYMYFKQHLLNFLSVIKKTTHYMWIRIDKKCFTKLHTDLLICVAYNPPEASKYHKADITEEISDDILSMSSKLNAYLLIGDLNARTGKLKDFDLEKNIERSRR